LSAKKGKSYLTLEELEGIELKGESLYQFKQLILLLLIGELYGLNTLKKILSSVGISSKNCYKVWGKFSYNTLYELISQGLVNDFKEHLSELCQLSESSWSRAELTIIIDETIFKTWLKCRIDDECYAEYYGKYFSGQTHKSEYGFRFSLTGVNIGKNFFPLYFNPIRKAEKCEEQAVEMIKKVGLLISQCAKKEGFTIPSIGLSLDAGYNKEELIASCEWLEQRIKTTVNFICVPRKNNIVQIGKFKGSINQYIKEVFLVKETQHKGDKEFFMRQKGFYKAKNREVVFLFFRLNNSNKVSVIYSTNLSIKAKTMRHRWFHRTKIEHFFRTIKHTLKVQQSTVDCTQGFFKKVILFALKAVFIKKFESYCRRKFRIFNNFTFVKLKHEIIYSVCDLSIIFNQLKSCGFCRHGTLRKAEYQYFRVIRNSLI